MTDDQQHPLTDHTGPQHDRQFQGQADRLRAPDRLARMEVPRVAALSLESIIGQSVLDIGTGTGAFAEAFAAQGLAVTGIDVTLFRCFKEMAETAARSRSSLSTGAMHAC